MQYAQISDLNIVTNLCIFYIDFYSHWLYNVYKLKRAVNKLIAFNRVATDKYPVNIADLFLQEVLLSRGVKSYLGSDTTSPVPCNNGKVQEDFTPCVKSGLTPLYQMLPQDSHSIPVLYLQG